MSALKLATDLSLPLDAVTQTFAVLAKRGAGKTYTASVLAEEMLKAGQQVVTIDPTGAWWGLRSDFPVVIFGGEHADVPLEESAGEVVARAVVERRFPAVLDLSLFRKGQMFRFMTAFAETLYRQNREAVHLFVDEADTVAPQTRHYGGDENRLLGAMEDIVRRGRKRGIGCTLITQRPQVLNKNVLTQCEVLIALRLVHPKDIDAIEEWVNVHGDPSTAKEMIASLPSLPIGEAWVWAPGWGDLFKRVKVRKRETFDSGATPKPGETPRRPKKLAPIDLAAIGEQVKATAEQARANDPAVLRKRIADLEKQLRELPAAEVKMVEVPVLSPEDIAALREEAGRVEAAAKDALLTFDAHAKFGAAIQQALDRIEAKRTHAPPLRLVNATARHTTLPLPQEGSAESSGDLTGPQQAILDTVLMLEARGIPATRDCVARWLGIHPNGGSYGANLGRLRAAGYLDGFSLTDRGRSSARSQPTGLEAALAALPDEPKRRIIRAVVEAGEGGLSRDELAARLNLHPNGGSYGANLGWLRTMGLLTQRGPIKATDGLLS